MSHAFVVVSVWHGEGRDRTFLHGVFDDLVTAEQVSHTVAEDHSYIQEEGYALEHTQGHSTYIAYLPRNQPVTDFVPTML
jgi:hypothetical protein